MTGKVRASVVQDIWELKGRLRQADLEELKCLQIGPEEALITGYHESDLCRTITVDDVPAAMFGVVAQDDRHERAIVWLLGSDDILTIRRQFLRESRQWLKVISRGYDRLYNVVHKDNSVHLRWLQWLGFYFGEPIPQTDLIPFAKDF